MSGRTRANTPTLDTQYMPMMSAAEVRQRIAWQEKVYEWHLRQPTQASLDFLGRKLVVHRNVFRPVPPAFNLMAATVLKEVREADTVLDVGTGSGIQAILAASKAKRVLAVDVSPEAVNCARRNVALNLEFPFWPSRDGQDTPIRGSGARSSSSSHDRCSVRSRLGR